VLEYPELGMEAVWKIEVRDFPAFIIVDDKGNDFFAEAAGPLLENFDVALGKARSLARGRSSTLRVGYLMSAAADCLNQSISVLRRESPGIKVKLFELSPGEQTAALRRGDIDVALLGYAGAFLDREFYTRRLATLRVFVALGETHSLASRVSVRLRDLRDEDFIGANEADMPGHNQWIIKLCRRARFRPRFVESAESLSQSLSLVVSDGAVALVSEHVKKMPFPGVVFLPISDADVGWEMFVAWQRGPTTEPLRAFLDSLPP